MTRRPCSTTSGPMPSPPTTAHPKAIPHCCSRSWFRSRLSAQDRRATTEPMTAPTGVLLTLTEHSRPPRPTSPAPNLAAVFPSDFGPAGRWYFEQEDRRSCRDFQTTDPDGWVEAGAVGPDRRPRTLARPAIPSTCDGTKSSDGWVEADPLARARSILPGQRGRHRHRRLRHVGERPHLVPRSRRHSIWYQGPGRRSYDRPDRNHRRLGHRSLGSARPTRPTDRWLDTVTYLCWSLLIVLILLTHRDLVAIYGAIDDLRIYEQSIVRSRLQDPLHLAGLRDRWNPRRHQLPPSAGSRR